ncbi:hypothetical protein FNV43_RR03180 [Rhamnella rubrinervis]|uniref:DNA ligase n=1 Tax=Rhamnella rubrinervis TaxID=2594499 RepID=A0A8K0HH87_9ROSA|nr:hypothetical protein FNV43_RR03180 [Rhamnella rubrinervis]
MTEETKFSVLCSLFNWMLRSKSAAKKRSKFRKFLDNFCKPSDYFSSIRLILPSLDRERGSYGLKESVLATSLIDALCMSRDSEDARRLINWRKGGAKTGANAGNFALVAAEVLQRRQGMSSGGLTINELNELLDRLASSESRAEKTTVLSTLIKKTNAQEMKSIIMIILKDLKLGISEKSIFHEFHPDAEDLFNVTCDLKLVCEKLSNRSQRHKRQDIEVGKAVRPQLAMRVGNATVAWKKLHGKEVLIECKFDGDRIQIHKNGTEVHYFSRNFLDHSEYGHAMSEVIIQNVMADRCILDGEMLVWDTSLSRFAEFGSNQEIAKAARDGLDSDRQLCYIAFDILYVGDTSVIHQSLKERHELLRTIVKPIKGRLEILVPNCGLNTHHSFGDPCWSLIANNVDDIERFFKETIENREEGIILKDLGSKWEPGDRSGKWLKLKPEYIRAGSDLDVLIIGGYYGSGRHGGEVAQFLVGLAERPAPNTYPRRVGTGLSDEELEAVVTKLKPHFRKYDYPKKAPPSFYHVTNHSKERPDVWIDSPEKSIILSITSDIRTISSEVFAAPYSLRFPRIDRVRYDKPWHECLDVQSFIELVHSSNGTTQRGKDYGGLQDNKPKRMKSSAREGKRNLLVVPSHFVHTDISGVKEDTLIFSNMMFYFINVPRTHSLDSLHKMVAENGGTFSMNLNHSVSHCIAAESKGIKYQAAKLRGDIIHYSWVLDCCSRRSLLPLQPKYFLFLSDSTKKKLREEIDEYSDSYYQDLDLADIKQLLSNVETSGDTKTVEHYKKKYCLMDKWSRFHGCFIYFHASAQSLKPDWEVVLGLALRRLNIEVYMGGGKVVDSLSHATHLVILSVPGFNVDFENVLRSLTIKEKHLLQKKQLHIVQSQWLEDSLGSEERFSEGTYSLKPALEELNIEQCEPDIDLEIPSDVDYVESQKFLSLSNGEDKDRRGKDALEEPRILASAEQGSKRKRGSPPGTRMNKGKAGANQAQRRRRIIRKNPAKISGDVLDECGSGDDNAFREESKTAEQDHGAIGKETMEIQETEMIEDTKSSQRGKAAKQEFVGDVSHGEWFSKAPEVETSKELNSEISKESEKLEIETDPVEAMLLDMIPSLGMKKVETTNTAVEDVKPPEDMNVEPKRKKKVSYKDVAGELLRDW